MMTEPTPTDSWGTILGLCYTEDAVARHLNIPINELRDAAEQQTWLRIYDDAGNALYPAFAFTENITPLPGLQKVLGWLTEYSPEPATWAWWLRTPHPDLEDGQTPEEALRAGINLTVLQKGIEADIAVANSDFFN